jgi:hypothetical protein
MFATTCSACAQQYLIFPNQVRQIDNTDRGIEVRFECWCGAEQTLLTGRRAAHRPRVAA